MAAPALGAETDPLARPSLVHPHATRALMLAVTRAGARLVSVGERGIVLVSDDDGRRWRQVPAPTSVTLASVHFPTERDGWAVGHAGIVLHTSDAGETWTKQLDGVRAARLALEDARARGVGPEALTTARRLVAEGADKPFLDVLFLDRWRGFVVGAYGQLFATTDGGATWLARQDRLGDAQARHLYCVRAAGSALYVAGEQGALYRSDDGGRSFLPLPSPVQGTVFGLLTTPSGGLLVHGLRGAAAWSDDRGAHWTPLRFPAATLTASLSLSDGSLLVAGQEGSLYRSADPGRGFTRIPSPRIPVTGVSQASDGALVLSGVRGLRRLPTQPLVDAS